MLKSHRGALMALGAATLLAALVFLFAKTAGTDFRHDSQALSLLREMRDLDSHWDDDAARLVNEFGTAAPKADFAGMIGRVLAELQRENTREPFRKDLALLRAGLEEKAAAFNALREAHGRSVVAARAFDQDLAALEPLAAARGNPRTAGTVQALRTDIPRRLETFATRVGVMEQRIATLRPEAGPGLGDAAGAADSSGRAFIDARRAEERAWNKLSFLTLGGRIDLSARTLSKALDATLDDKERWRVYLFFYAAALLIVVVYLGMRVAQTQAALRRANEDLEARVAERTRDLSQTLKRLQESEAQLVQSEKMSSLGQMVAGVAHEINSPLAYVKNSVATARDRMPHLREALARAERLLELLRRESPDPAELQQAFEGLEDKLARIKREHVIEDLEGLTRDGLHGIEQIVELVANLRNFSRLDRSKVASFNVNEGVRATLLIAQSAMRKVDVERRLGDVPSITCSPSQVNQVLLNLLNNSAQAMDKPRGHIVVTTRPAGDRAVAIDVEDNGKGIEPDALPRIFDPFYTTKEPGKGTGLGLSIAYKIVSQHGGRIDVKSTVGVGTLITVILPIEPPPELAKLTSEATA
ncbi:MAG TPA: ATP-binding protein [Usitatibacter sp.]|nr:ATP-binding protein [Usitatibacter sp.]